MLFRSYNRASENERKEIIGWTKELFEQVSNFISQPNKTKVINELFQQTFGEINENSAVSKKSVLGARRVAGAIAGAKRSSGEERDPSVGGIPRSSLNRAEPTVAEEASPDAGKKKEKPFRRKQAVAPSSYFDSKIGTVPSGGIGLTAYRTESAKPFSQFRKTGTEPTKE